jgi:hypothetical protein
MIYFYSSIKRCTGIFIDIKRISSKSPISWFVIFAHIHIFFSPTPWFHFFMDFFSYPYDFFVMFSFFSGYFHRYNCYRYIGYYSCFHFFWILSSLSLLLFSMCSTHFFLKGSMLERCRSFTLSYIFIIRVSFSVLFLVFSCPPFSLYKEICFSLVGFRSK